ncbi:MAG: autotransporter outer membrane beta-barrel domain-containing protein [Endomicrobiaceae bacterium]|nr:autotransporter outer membrane beta-barrel domain-containing protein [Endomicrobiaceae bacterium]
MSNSNSLGTGKILFDSGVRGDSTTYASIGVSSLTVGTIDLLNNIHIDEGAVFNVYDGQQISLKGDISRYNTSTGYETEFVKTGLGLLEIAKSSSTIRKVNMSTFTVQEGGFNLDENVVLNSYFSLNSDSAYLSMENGAGVKNTIDIDAGDLIIFNDSNISTATVNFNSTSTVNLSQLHITSNTVLSTATLQNPITVTKGIDFVIDATTTANLNTFNFVATNDSIIEKSGDGDFNFNTNNTNFTLSNLTVDGGYFNLVSNSSMTVSSTTVVDGGILAFEQGSFFQSSASGVDEKIIVSSGGIKIYDDNNIEGSTLLSFEGTDQNNLAKLIVEADNVNLTNSIFVKTGVIVENENNLTISGDSIDYDSASSGIFAKSGAGTMTIAQTSGGAGFDMGELVVLEGLMNVTTDVNVSTVVVTGYTSSMNINNSTMTVVNDFDLFDYDSFQLSSATLNIGNDLSLSSGSFTLNNSTVTVANKLDMLDIALFSVSGSSVTAQSLIGENIANDISISTSNVIVASSMTLTDFASLDIFNSGLTVGTDLTLSSGSFTLNNSTVTVVNSLDMNDLALFSVEGSSLTTQSLIGSIIANDISISTSNVIVASSMTLTDFASLDIFNSGLTVGTDLTLSSGSFTVNNSTVSVVDSLNIDDLSLFSIAGSTLTAKEIMVENIDIVDISTTSNVIVSSSMALTNFTNLTVFTSSLTVGTDLTLSSGTAAFTNSNLFVGKDLTFTDSIFEISTTSLNVSSNVYFTSSNLIFSSSSISSDYMSVYNSSITLRNESILTSDIDLDNASILKGSGTVNGFLNVKSNANVSIGETSQDLGKISVNSINFNSGSTLYVDVKSSNSVTSNDQLEVLGNITVEDGVTLDVNINGDNSEFNRKKSFEIITYTGVLDPLNASIFDNIILSSARLKADVESIGNSIVLNVFQRWSSYTLPEKTTNQQVMMDALNNICDDPSASVIFDATLSKMDELYGDYQDTGNSLSFITAMADLSGLMYANSFQSSALLANSKVNMTYNRLIDFEDRDQNNIWAQVYTNTQSIEKNEGNAKFENNVSGLIAGFDTFTTEDFVVGISGFYGTGQFKQLEDKADINDAGVNAYAYYQYDDIEIKGLMGYGIQNYEATRKIRFINQEIKSDYSVNVLNFDIEAAYKYSLNNTMILKPLVGLNCTVTSNDQILEKGDLEQKLCIDSGNYTKADFRVGIGLQSNNSSKFNWYVSAIAKQIVDGDKLTMTASFAEIPNEKFEIESTKLSSSVFSGNIGGLYTLTQDVNLFIDLSSDTSSSTNMLSGNVGASYRW